MYLPQTNERHDGLLILDKMVGQLISEVRAFHDISRETLAEMIGRPPNEVEQWETGTKPADLSALWLMAQVLGFQVEYFTDGLSFSVEADRWELEHPRPAIEGPPDRPT